MTDDRPAPQYGEYATPEQQAAAMGKRYVPPPAAETRVIVPGVPTPGAASDEAERPSLRLRGNLVDRFITIFQLGMGLVFLLSSDYFHLSEDANSGMAELGFTQKIPATIDQYGWVILAVNIVLLLLTCAWALAWLRRGRLAFYIPFVGYLAFVAFLGIVISIVR